MIKDIRFWLVAVIGAVLLITALGNRDLWNPDEPRYALVAREMVEGGDWLVMHRNGEIYPDKPPMYFWAEGLLSRITGDVDEFTARFPATLAGIGVVVLTMLMGARLFGRATGVLSGVVLLATYSFFMHSRSVHMDIPITLTMLGMFYVMYRLAFGGNPKSTGLWIAFFALGAIGTLIKGPIGLLVPMFAGFSYLVVRRTAHIERRGRWLVILAAFSLVGMILGGMKGMVVAILPGAIVLFLVGGARPAVNRGTILGFALFLAIMAAWLVPACISGGHEFTDEILFRQNLTRYADAFSHEQPFWYFFTRLPEMFLPWIIFLPQAIAMIFRKGALDETRKRHAIFVLVCAAAIFVFFSVSTSKRHIYLLPALPLMSMLVALYLRKILRRPKAQTGSRVPKSYPIVLSIFAAAIILFAIAMPIMPQVLANSDKDEIKKAVDVLRVYTPFLITACIALGMSAAFVIYSCVKRHYRAALVGTVTTMMLMILGTEYYALHVLIDGEKSARQPALHINALTADADEVACYQKPHEGLAYYGRMKFKQVDDMEEFVEYMSDPLQVRYCVMTEKRAHNIEADITAGKSYFIKVGPDEKPKFFIGTLEDGDRICFTETGVDSNDSRPRLCFRMYRIYSEGIGSKDMVLLSNRKKDEVPELKRDETEAGE